MSTIYIFDNALLGDNGAEFYPALVESKTCASDADCLAWFESKYGSNDYTASFVAPQ